MGRRNFKLGYLNPNFIDKQDYFFLFETSSCDKDNFSSYIFIDPVKIIKVNDFKEVPEAFKEIEKYSSEFYLAGYFSYELGYFFEQSSLRTRTRFDYPLIHLAVFKKRFYFNHKTGQNNIHIPGIFTKSGQNRSFKIDSLKFNLSCDQYQNKINQIKNYIRKGDTYQVNFTGKCKFKFSGSPLGLYNDLMQRQSVAYGAFCKLKDEYVISLSPELFFKRDGSKIISQPMKGTIKRGKGLKEDKLNIAELKSSIKNRAENLMIVDLIRNDLGRVSKTGSVKADQLFEISKYDTLFQMTSNVTATLKNGVTYLDIFKSAFPGGSVTGAPKIRTMQIIKELENSPRNIYCGALGMIAPKAEAVFNLPIRTLSINKCKGEMGVGSGIVYDSHPEEEFKECALKAKFLTDRYKEFKIIETLLWDGSYKFLTGHLKRLKDSAQYFDFAYNRSEIILELRTVSRNFHQGNRYRVRLLLGKDENIQIEHTKAPDDTAAQNFVAISKYRTNPEDVFLYHKTTNRSLYDSEFRRYRAKGYFEVIFLNTRNEFTEGAISNIIIQKGNRYFTSPVYSGLLPGVYREYLLKNKKIEERILRSKDLKEAKRIFVCNSVRGMVEVKLKNVHSRCPV